MATLSKDERDAVIDKWPVRTVLELSGKARGYLLLLNQFKDAIGYIPGKLDETFQSGVLDPGSEEIQKTANDLVDAKPFAGYFSIRTDPIQHPMMEVCLRQNRKFVTDMCWTVVFADYNKHLGMTIDVFNFLQLKVEAALNGCMVAGYRFTDEGEGEIMSNGPEQT